MTVLILGSQEDDHACHVQEHLRTRGADVEMLDSRWFPSQAQISYDPRDGGGTLRLPCGRLLNFPEIRSVYWRCYNSVQTPVLADPDQAYIAANDARALFESVLIGLPARWVNGWTAFQMHQTKPVQLARVAELGVPVPATLLSNDPDGVRRFADQGRSLIFKPIQGGAHTQRVTPAHLTAENLASLACAPVTLQEEVPGTNIRVFVAGDVVYSCEVRTDAIDFRDDPDPLIVRHDLPAGVAEQALRIARALELLWTGIDFRLTPRGCYVFLEANPSPMFLGFEARCGLPLTESLAALLLQ